ncbi:response regulator transcription factor [Rhizobium halophilum]|uniref:response regulator transcription factor n=1 Tax=Rhizobium halophilum TaxID=2846852 RepID=UPI001EFD7CAE|nr:response regulator [Rhizobium halophilum]MCF6371348.1 response regulator [Rhizobium halophilum]
MLAVVDDDPFVRDALKNLLLSVDYEVETFESAEAYLSAENAEEYSCIIADVRMDGMTGIDMQDQLRSQDVYTPIIFLTAYCDEATRERAMAGGAFSFVCKPFDEDELLGLLGAVASKH